MQARMKKKLLSAVMLCALGLVGCDDGGTDPDPNPEPAKKYDTPDKIETITIDPATGAIWVGTKSQGALLIAGAGGASATEAAAGAGMEEAGMAQYAALMGQGQAPAAPREPPGTYPERWISGSSSAGWRGSSGTRSAPRESSAAPPTPPPRSTA